MTGSVHGFRPMTAADIPMALDWLAQPHVARWWDVEGMEGELTRGLDAPWMRYLILTLDGAPVGLLQVYDIWKEHACAGAHPDAAAEGPFDDQPAGTVGIDYAIGRADLIGKGHGTAFIRTVSDWLIDQGAPRVIADPPPTHPASIGACVRAGFAPAGERDTDDGRVLLMVRERR